MMAHQWVRPSRSLTFTIPCMRLKRTIAVAPRLHAALLRYCEAGTPRRSSAVADVQQAGRAHALHRQRVVGRRAPRRNDPDGSDDLSALAMDQQHMARVGIEFVCFDAIASGFESPLHAVHLISQPTSRTNELLGCPQGQPKSRCLYVDLLTQILNFHDNPPSFRPRNPIASDCPPLSTA